MRTSLRVLTAPGEDTPLKNRPLKSTSLVACLPAAVLVLVLLSNFMFWLKIEHHLFALYFIQVRVERKLYEEGKYFMSEQRRCGFYLLQAAVVSLQGFLNSMVYAWRRRNFTEAILGENTPLLAYDRLAFFDQSLTTSSWLLPPSAWEPLPGYSSTLLAWWAAGLP